MTKDYIKFRNAIKNDENLSLEEAYLLENIFDYYNVDLGYAYPSYDILMKDLKTKRRAKISKLIKSLVKKGYIEVNKKSNKNTYKLIKYLFVNTKAQKPKEEIEIAEEDIEKVETETNFSKKESKELLKIAKGKLEKVFKAFRYMLQQKNIENKFAYTRWAIRNNKEPCNNSSAPNHNGFNNFKAREYDYEDLEWRLLGWK